MRWRVDPLSLALTVSAAAAEALAIAPWVTWLAALFQTITNSINP